MTKNLLLVEDEPLAQARIKSIILKHFPEWNLEEPIQTVKELSSALEHQENFDLILCDIHLADGLSFTAFRGRDIKVPVIFITAYDQYALQSFEHNCIDYILKPIQEERLVKAFEKYRSISLSNKSLLPLSKDYVEEFLIRYNHRNFKKRFLTRSGNRLCFIPTDSVAYFYAEDGITFLIEAGSSQRHIVDHSLNELEKDLLDPNKFYRINRSVIINLENLVEMRPYVNGRLLVSLNVKSDEALIVAREKVSEFKSWINQ
ncbi:LytTR family DNA-binding domain-containing protein [Algoriphagus sp. AK58]|uniref:LytR/AlgR family response regulator transcription factor n=1 Tax=Algoriphagus sp. AK58 TaxID=1406877 RepID=UPI001650C3D6|nr:LytTR family DNA-binding domain-containing protein [Algoriphagus sp. AK58]MBC6368572.1 LytTR family transcriptional regulator [Algoriphagus sp. AK58]